MTINVCPRSCLGVLRLANSLYPGQGLSTPDLSECFACWKYISGIEKGQSVF